MPIAAVILYLQEELIPNALMNQFYQHVLLEFALSNPKYQGVPNPGHYQMLYLSKF
jgi:hypothetical protein